MCCSGCCNGCGECTGNIVYIMEKLASFAALTAVVICVMITIAVTLGLGIGLGYNHCFVDLRVKSDDSQNPSAMRQSLRDGEDLRRHSEKLRRENEIPKRTFSTTEESARRTYPLPAIKHTMAIPLNREIDFPALLSKLRNRNRNVTLELIT
ncbi:uncharacterized protein LOC113500345 [Trichoplusia ni]|uniref:Uncharacterized protein LOC113500345 n=1 Tax=Trichoplusia ni TaxID=7111 RepID=A0A7E5W8D9_TRINI|nr:uncharacterized protein LOC113500345 [Trichoplusia ni]XP_026736905.1 uncharacterized protein LOC113500345 [Trichoplusia ni]